MNGELYVGRPIRGGEGVGRGEIFFSVVESRRGKEGERRGEEARSGRGVGV